MSRTMDHPFIIGERYADRRGEYTVVGIEGERLRIRYEDGTESEGSLIIKARIFKNILDEQKVFHPIQSEGYFFSLGYLAAHSEFHAEVPPQSQPGFEQNYILLTGVRPALHSDGYFPIHIETTWDKWGPELRIYFPEPKADLELPPFVDPRPGNEAGTLRINSNRFWWLLVRIGFRLGKIHDVGKIRATIPASLQPRFDLGMRS